jgi:hypothetical protein
MNLTFKIYQYFVWVSTLCFAGLGYYDVYLKDGERGFSLIVIVPALVLIYVVYGILFLIKYLKYGNEATANGSTNNKLSSLTLLAFVFFVMFILFRFYL